MRRVTRSCFVAVVILSWWPASTVFAQAICGMTPDWRKYFENWVGVKAPPIGPNATDRAFGPLITIEQYRGKRLLLLGFDSGNFVVGGPPMAEVREVITAVNQALTAAGKGRFAAVGFTAGMEFFFPIDNMAEEQRELGRLPEFPIANTTNREFNDPYGMLSGPGGIVIDANGVILAVYARKMTTTEIAEAAKLPDWSGETRKSPKQHPWAGRQPPKPIGTFHRIWRTELPNTGPTESFNRRRWPVMALGHGDWDSDGHDDILAINIDGIMHVIGHDGRVKQAFKLSQQPSTVSPEIQTTEHRRGTVVAFQSPVGWPHSILLIGQNGEPGSKYPLLGSSAINAAAFVDLDGSGCKNLILGCNGSAGLSVKQCDTKLRWADPNLGNVWDVAGLDAKDGRPGLVLCAPSDAAICVLDRDGKLLRKLPNQGRFILEFEVAEMNKQGDRQILANWPAHAGAPACVAASDLDGNVIWTYPIEISERRGSHGSMRAAQITGDDTRQWVVSGNDGDFVVLDATGQLLAKLARHRSPPDCWTPLERSGKAGLLIVSDSDGIAAYALEMP